MQSPLQGLVPEAHDGLQLWDWASHARGWPGAAGQSESMQQPVATMQTPLQPRYPAAQRGGGEGCPASGLRGGVVEPTPPAPPVGGVALPPAPPWPIELGGGALCGPAASGPDPARSGPVPGVPPATGLGTNVPAASSPAPPRGSFRGRSQPAKVSAASRRVASTTPLGEPPDALSNRCVRPSDTGSALPWPASAAQDVYCAVAGCRISGSTRQSRLPGASRHRRSGTRPEPGARRGRIAVVWLAPSCRPSWRPPDTRT